jgi:hypothetical protein
MAAVRITLAFATTLAFEDEDSDKTAISLSPRTSKIKRMLIDNPLLSYFAVAIAAAGVAMIVRWLVTKTDNRKALVNGLLKGAVIEFIGLAGIFIFQRTPNIATYSAVGAIGLGTVLGVIFGRLLQVPD